VPSWGSSGGRGRNGAAGWAEVGRLGAGWSSRADQGRRNRLGAGWGPPTTPARGWNRSVFRVYRRRRAWLNSVAMPSIRGFRWAEGTSRTAGQPGRRWHRKGARAGFPASTDHLRGCWIVTTKEPGRGRPAGAATCWRRSKGAGGACWARHGLGMHGWVATRAKRPAGKAEENGSKDRAHDGKQSQGQHGGWGEGCLRPHQGLGWRRRPWPESGRRFGGH